MGRISRQWFKIRDTYGVEVETGEDLALVIAIASASTGCARSSRGAASAANRGLSGF